MFHVSFQIKIIKTINDNQTIFFGSIVSSILKHMTGRSLALLGR